ncbi:DUF1294 domain-containing protein [Carnobacteriaceae bacterium zg-ZUI240]|nr:DUF1294 domain-containing protein [Carnobacteriaceae bacterium zg-ZUI240]
MIWVMLLLNLNAFLLFALDKRKAKKRLYRTSEKTLLLSLVFGSFGGYFAMMMCHHKTKKWYFHVVAIMSMLLTIGLYEKISRLMM